MLKPVPSLQARQKRDKRLVFELAMLQAESHIVTKRLDTDPPLPPRDAAIQLTNPKIITGEALAQFSDSKSQIYVRNINLIDSATGAIILQRFGPTSLRHSDDMRESAEHGADLLKEVTAHSRCKKHSAATRQTKEQQVFPHYHFGAWYDKFGNNLVLTGETSQAGNEEGKKPVTDFCAWFKLFAIEYIQPLVDNKDSGLCGAFRSELIERQARHFLWAKKQVSGLERLCHSLYSTLSPFQGFSGTSHVDDRDADVSILVNLGQHAILELRDYNCHIVLQPLDVVVFLSNSVYHRTLQHPAHIAAKSKAGERMAITCFFRKALLEQKEPKKQNILYLAEISEEQERERKRQKKSM